MIQFLQQTGPTYAGTNDVVCPVAVMGARLWGDVGSSAKSLRGPSTERARRSSARPCGSAWCSASPNPPSLRQFKGSVSSQVRYRAGHHLRCRRVELHASTATVFGDGGGRVLTIR